MIGLVGGLFGVSWFFLMRSFTNIEEDFASQNLGRASSALYNELEILDRTTSEYASWDQTYAYLQGKNPSYIATEFPTSPFVNLRVHFGAFFNNSGQLFYHTV